MPIPSVNKGEDQATYVGRCMHEIASEYDTNEQAVAICINTYEKENMSKDMGERVAMKIAGIELYKEYTQKDADDIQS